MFTNGNIDHSLICYRNTIVKYFMAIINAVRPLINYRHEKLPHS